MRYQRHSSPSRPSLPRRRRLLLLAALLAACLLYGCVAGTACSPRGRLVFVPLAQIWGHSTTSVFLP